MEIINDDRLNMSRPKYAAPSSIGKLPPQAPELEEGVLGGLMEWTDAYLSIGTFLKSECFYRDDHRRIFEAITELFNEAKPVDVLSVTQKLRSRGELEMVGGAYRIAQLTMKSSRIMSLEEHGRIIYQKYLQRELIRISSETISAAYDDTTDIFNLHDYNQSKVFELFSDNYGREALGIKQLVLESLIEMKKQPIKDLTGVGSGFFKVDKLTGGWQKGDLTILAARPAMGKTALMLQIARNAAIDFDTPTAIFSLEMTSRQLTNRLIANEADIYLEKINKKILTDIDHQIIEDGVKKLQESKIIVDDTPGLSIEAFRTKAMRLKKMYNIGLIVIDYLQLMTVKTESRGRSREQEIGVISRNLKAVAKELDIPIIALSQLSRSVEQRPGGTKRPMLSDLRESGSIEQDADNVFFMFRPEYYGITMDSDNNSTIGLCELICAKNRNGACETVALDFNGALMRFKDWDADYAPVSFSSRKRKPTDQAVIDFTAPVEKDDDDIPF